MKNLSCFPSKLSCLNHSSRISFSYFFRVLIFRVNPFWIQLIYFIITSFFGYLALKISMPKNASFRPKSLDLFFMSASASTVTSLSTVKMEVFSNIQLIIFTLLMFLGGEVFVSMLGLQLMKFKFTKEQENTQNRVYSALSSTNSLHQLELGSITHQQINIDEKPNSLIDSEINLKYKCIRTLGFVVLTYFLVVHILGSVLVAIYLLFVQSSREVLKKKGLSIITFSIFTTVSTFSNCGFIPTNENMLVFKKNTGLLLILAPQILLGNTLYPPSLRAVIEFLERFTKRVEFGYILKNWRDLGYNHLLSRKHCGFLAMSVFGFILVMFVTFWSMEWNSNVMEGLSSYEKVVGTLFVVVNTRHTGESVFNLSMVSPAILVLFVFMMYLPPYTSFLPIEDKDEEALSTFDKSKRKRKSKSTTLLLLMENLLFSHISYLVIFTILICITEREKLKEDPLNFNALNIIFEVTIAYGNVGFSTGYSCQRQLKPDGYCKDTNYGFVGRWSGKGKFILIIVMLFGRLKKFSMKGGKAWKLS